MPDESNPSMHDKSVISRGACTFTIRMIPSISRKKVLNEAIDLPLRRCDSVITKGFKRKEIVFRVYRRHRTTKIKEIVMYSMPHILG